MNRCDCDVRGVCSGLARYPPGREYVGGEHRNLRSNVQQWNCFDHLQTFPRRPSVARARLVNHKLRNEELKRLPARFPPIPSDLLVSCDHQIPAGPGSQVTRNRGFQVDPRLHDLDGNLVSNSTVVRAPAAPIDPVIKGDYHGDSKVLYYYAKITTERGTGASNVTLSPAARMPKKAIVGQHD